MSAPTLERRTATPEGIAATSEVRQTETNDLNDRFNQKISVCKIAKGAMFIHRDITVMDALEEIRDGTHAAAVNTVRDAVAIYGKETPEVKTAKCALPAFLFSGKIEGKVKQAMEEGRFLHSGLLQLDFDKLDDPAAIRDQIAQDPHVLAAWLSPSGDGVKGLFVIEPATTKAEHLAAFFTAEAYWHDRGLTLDSACKNSNRLCFASHDPDLKWNEDALQLATAPPPRTAPKAAAPAKPSTTSPILKLGLNAIIPQPPHDGIHDWMLNGVRSCEQHGMTQADTFAKFKAYDGTLRRPFDHNELENACRDIFATPSATFTTGADVDPAQAETLRERAYRMRFDADAPPPPDETCMSIGGIPIAARGNLTVPQGKSKVGKSAVISAILGAATRGEHAAVGDTLKIEWEGLATGAIVHLDTEQSLSDWHALVCRGITRSGLPDASDRIVSLPLIPFTRSERLAILKATLEFEKKRLGSIDLVLIDGIADLCVSPNDESEALELVARVHALAQDFHCPIFCVLHENPSSSTDLPKTRGHLGSELNRKAFANLRIDKDTATSVSTIYGSDMRKQDIPKEQGFCFAWDEAKQMHTFQGRAAGLKASQKEQKQVAEFREVFEPIYEHASNGTKTACPVLSPIEVIKIEQDMNGTEKPASEAAWKKRMQRAEMLGVLRKGDRGKWSFNETGQMGQKRDKVI